MVLIGRQLLLSNQRGRRSARFERLTPCRIYGNTRQRKYSMLEKIQRHPLEYATIPAVAAFVGLGTNWLGVKMLFYPIEYSGWRWYRKDALTPYGILGWQGVVPCKTEKMAGHLVDIVTCKLLSLQEAFARLDANELSVLLLPAVQEAVARDCGPVWTALLRPVLPILLPRIITNLQKEVASILDLRSVVLSAFVRDKEVLVELFQSVGKVELKFLVESGLGFGALLGIIQMGAWAIAPRPWTLPVAGALVGYITNYIAIKLLFEPANPVSVGPFVLQGLFESRQTEVSEEFGQFMAQRVLSSSRLLTALADKRPKGDTSVAVEDEEYYEDMDEKGGALYKFLRRQLPRPIPSHILKAAVRAIRTASEETQHRELHRYLSTTLDIEHTLSSRLKTLSCTEFEDLLHPVFQEDEATLIAVGGVLGGIAGMMQTKLGWGGPSSRIRAIFTLATVGVSTIAYFLYPDKELVVVKVEVEKAEEEEKVVGAEKEEIMIRPVLTRRNTLVIVRPTMS